MLRHVSRVALIVGLLLTVTACGDSGSDNTSGGGPSFNDADVTFAQQMIPHHKSAIEMAEMAETRAAAPEVKALAARIKAAQEPEIDMLQGFLETYGEEPDETMAGMDDESMPGMDMGSSGMGMSEDEMKQLDAATGAAFDMMFLQMMVKHHSSAVEMAATEIDKGEHEPAITLAKKVKADQTEEIAEMEKLLASL